MLNILGICTHNNDKQYYSNWFPNLSLPIGNAFWTLN